MIDADLFGIENGEKKKEEKVTNEAEVKRLIAMAIIAAS